MPTWISTLLLKLVKLTPFHVQLLLQLGVELSFLVELLNQGAVVLLELLEVEVHRLKHFAHELVLLREGLHPA